MAMMEESHSEIKLQINRVETDIAVEMRHDGWKWMEIKDGRINKAKTERAVEEEDDDDGMLESD